MSGALPGDDLPREELLAELDALLRANPLYAYNHPTLSRQLHPKQLEFHASRDSLKCLMGGNRSGKTTAGICDDLIQTLSDEDVPEHLRPFKKWRPPFYCRLVIPDLTKNLDGVILQKVREWCPPGALRGGSVEKAWNDRLGTLSFENGSWWQIMSNDQDLGKFGGAALHRVHYDEEPIETIRRECRMRLIDFDGDELLTMTPLQGLSWTFSEVFEPWQQGVKSDCTIVMVDMDENPHLPTEAKERVLEGLSSEERAARKSGVYVHFAGKIYPQFTRDRHVIPALGKLPEGVKALSAIDPGIGHKCGVLWLYLDENDTVVLFDEFVESDLTVEEIVRVMRLREAYWRITPWPRIIDPAARNRNPVTGHSTQYEFERHKIYTELGHNDVRAGINAVRERLQREEPPGLLIAENCVQTIREFGRYRWRTPPRSPESAVRPSPVKRDDDALDALRYACMSELVRPKAVADETATEALRRIRRRRATGDGSVYPAGVGMFD